MPRFNSEWKVDPHGRLRKLDQGLLTVAGEIQMPLGNFPRRVTVIGLTGQRTAIWSAISLAEPSVATKLYGAHARRARCMPRKSIDAVELRCLKAGGMPSLSCILSSVLIGIPMPS